MTKEINGIKIFGVWPGMDYNITIDTFEDFQGYFKLNKIEKAVVADHIRNLDDALASGPVYDIFSGNKIANNHGMYEDGPFNFPIDFLYYYENYDIGIPQEYEDYLINVKHLK